MKARQGPSECSAPFTPSRVWNWYLGDDSLNSNVELLTRLSRTEGPSHSVQQVSGFFGNPSEHFRKSPIGCCDGLHCTTWVFESFRSFLNFVLPGSSDRFMVIVVFIIRSLLTIPSLVHDVDVDSLMFMMSSQTSSSL